MLLKGRKERINLFLQYTKTAGINPQHCLVHFGQDRAESAETSVLAPLVCQTKVKVGF